MPRATNDDSFATMRWMFDDGELVVVSEAVNRESRIANRGDAARGSFGGFGALRCELSTDRVCESEHFSVFALDGSIVVFHRLEAGEIDNDIAEMVASELVRPGLVELPNAFERCFAGVVLSSAPDAASAWRMFYGNTLAKLERVASEGRADGDFAPTSVFGGIYEHARSLVVGSSVLDVGTCFGFFPMLAKRSQPDMEITALDLSAPMVALAESIEKNLSFARGDAGDLPFADDAFDTVVSLHVLEHLPPESARMAVREMRRVSRRRVVVAVPLEEKPDPAYGHVRCFDRASLTKLAEADGWGCAFEEYLGGWVVLDAPGERA